MIPPTAVVGIGTLAYNCFKDLGICLKPHYDRMADMNKNFEKLEREYRDLAAEKSAMDDTIRKNKHAMALTPQCRNLKHKVSGTEKKFQNLETDYHHAFERCLCGLCPSVNLIKVANDIIETTEEVVRLTNEMKELNQHGNVLTNRPELNKTMGVADSTVELESQSQKVQELLKYLRDETVKRIGIWGMEGIGKTTLLKKLNIEAKRKGGFDCIIFVSVGREYSVRKIQEDLLKQLKLVRKTPTWMLILKKLSVNDTNMDLAASISEGLKETKYLLLLDDVFSVINLDDLGIRDTHKYGKVVIACREKCVFENMDVHERMSLKTLPLKDAQTLFQAIVGDVIKNYSGLKHHAERIVKELGGLPWLIRAVATTLKNENSETKWGTTAKALKSTSVSQLEHLHDVLIVLNHVFDQLPAERKRCLLYMSLFPRDHEIYDDYLVECWRIQRYIHDDPPVSGSCNHQPFREARDEGHEILKNLIDIFLLERCTSKLKYIRMPSLVRKLAKTLYPGEEGCKPLVVAGEHLKDPPPEEQWRSAKDWISMMCNELQSLPKNPKCPEITTLLLQKNENLQNIPKSFFVHMCKLQFLDLHRTGIKSLPSSLFNLINLRGLYLNQCRNLVVLSTKIAKLKNLEVLDIRETGIPSLPIAIGKLGNLKCFRVSFSCTTTNSLNTKCNILHFWKHEKQGVIIPRNVIKKLHQLEELTIIVDPEEQSWNQIVDIIAEEVAGLKVLTTLCFYFPHVESLKTFVTKSNSWENEENFFRSYKMLVGYHQANHTHELNSSFNSDRRLLRFSSGEIITEEIGKVLKQASAFELIGNSNVLSLSQFGLENMKSLEVCVIQECGMMGSIVDCNNSDVGAVFPVLEKLHIITQQQLKYFWRGPEVQGSLIRLTTLTLTDCPMLTTILSHGITQQLRQLQYLRVENCSLITEIIEAESHSPVAEITEDFNLAHTLPNLETLELVNLPILESICRSDVLGWPFLETIEINRCPELRNLSLSNTNAKKLVNIRCNKYWWDSLQLQQDGLKQHLEPHCYFIDEEPESPSPSVYSTPPQGSPCHEIIHNQRPDGDIELVECTLANHMTGCASSSRTAAARPPNDPSSSSWASR